MIKTFFFALVIVSLSSKAAISSPESTVTRYYELLASNQCLEALKLRPGASENLCKVKEIHFLSVSTVSVDEEVAIVRLQINYSANASERIKFDGYVVMRATYESGWSIVHDGFFTDKLKAQKKALKDKENVRITQYSHPLDGFCWDAQATMHKDGEEVPQRKESGKIVRKPTKSTPAQNHLPLSASLHGSIRSVDVGQEKLVALTFDIGEQNNDLAGYDGRIIDTLRKHRVHATLYLGGKWMLTHPKRTFQLISDPLFEIGNHAWTHGNFRMLSEKQRAEQIDFTQAQYETFVESLDNAPCFKSAKESGQDRLAFDQSIKTFRFPYGTCNKASFADLADRGLPAVQWDVVSADAWKAQTSAKMIKHVLKKTEPGSIILMHANGRGWKTHLAIEPIILGLKTRGYSFLTVSDLLSSGTPRTYSECFENLPGDNKRYDNIFGKGTWRGEKDYR